MKIADGMMIIHGSAQMVLVITLEISQTMNFVVRGGKMSDLKLMSLLKMLHEENKAIVQVLASLYHAKQEHIDETFDRWDAVWNKIVNMDDEKK